MDVRQAARTAREYVTDLFADEEIDKVFLEEVDFDHESDVWRITVSFSRPTGEPNPIGAVAPRHPLADTTTVRRSYKVVNVDDTSGSVLSVKHRALTVAD